METARAIRFPVSRATLVWGYIARFVLTGIICWYGLSRDADFAVFFFLMLFPLLAVLWINFLKIPKEVIFRGHQLAFKAVTGTVRINVNDILYIDDVDGGRYTRFETFNSWIRLPSRINNKEKLASLLKKVNPGVQFPPIRTDTGPGTKTGRGIQIIVLGILCVIFVSLCLWMQHGNTPDPRSITLTDYLSPMVILFALCASLLFVYWDLPYRAAPSKRSIARNTAKWFYMVSLAYFNDTGATTVDVDGPRGFTPDPSVTISGGPMSVSDEGTVSFKTPMIFKYQGASEEFVLQPDGTVLQVTDAFINSAGQGDLHQVKHFLARGIDMDARDDDYDTAFLAALKGGHPEVVLTLLDRG